MARKVRHRAAKARKRRRNAKGKPGTKHKPSPALQKTQVDDLTDVLDVDQAAEIAGEDEVIVEEEEQLGDAASPDPHGEGRPPHDD